MASVAQHAVAAERAITLTADTVRWQADDKVTASGHVVAVYEDYKVTADSANADLQTNIAVFEGNVNFTTTNRSVQGERITINLKTKDWSFESAVTHLGAETFESNPNAHAVIRTQELTGNETEPLRPLGELHHLRPRSSALHASTRDGSTSIPRAGSSRTASRSSVLDKRLFSVDSMVIPIKGLGNDHPAADRIERGGGRHS